MSNDAQNIISGLSNTFDTGIARTLGLNAAIVFQHIIYWLRVNSKKKDVELIEGKVWMYETQKEIASYFEYLSEDEVYKAIKKLVESGLLIKGCFNDNPFDRTGWYTTFDQSIFMDKPKLKESLRNRQLTESESVNGRDQIPLRDEIRNRQETECNIHNHNQEEKQKEHHHQESDEFFSKIEEDEILKKYSTSQIDEAKLITLQKCKAPEARKKYFRTVLENMKPNQPSPQKSSSNLVSFPESSYKKPINQNVETNIKTAERFIIEKQWGNLFIRSTYVEDKRYSGKELSLNMNPVEFEASLTNLYNSLNR